VLKETREAKGFKDLRETPVLQVQEVLQVLMVKTELTEPRVTKGTKV
jgi:hypothetical protein